MEERVMIFIDGANLFHGCKNHEKGYRVDILKLKDELVDNRKLIRAYYYGSIPTDDKNKYGSQKKFFDMLEYEGFTVSVIPLKQRRGKYTCENCGKENEIKKEVEKGVDIALATDMISFGINDHYDTAIVVSGDYDYFRAVEEIQRNGKRVEIAYFRNDGISEKFIRCADKFLALDEISDKIKKN
jgi:uncharacterized LabA/DUF88 family protein